MKIAINASFSRKKYTGLGQVTVHFVKNLIKVTQEMDLEDSENNLNNIDKSLNSNNNSNQSEDKFFIYLEKNWPEKINWPANFQERKFLPKWKRDDLVRKIKWEKKLLPRQMKKDQAEVLISLYQSPTIIKHKFKKPITTSTGRHLEKPRHIMVVHDIIPLLFKKDYLNNFRKRLYWKMIKKAISQADHLVAVSENTKQDLIEHLKIEEDKVIVAPIDVDLIYKKEVKLEKTQSVLEKYNLEPGYIFNAGGLEKRKNVEGLIRAYCQLVEKIKNENWQKPVPLLVIAGKLMPELAPLITDAQNLIQDLRLDKQVKLLDFVPQKDMPALYRNSLFFCYPSLYEGFGMPVLESMSQGRTGVTSETSSLPEVADNTFYYCDPENIESIMEAMKEMIVNDYLRENLEKKAQKRSKEFNWLKFIEKIWGVL